MTPVRLEISPRSHPEPRLLHNEIALLNYLRFVSLGCRAKPRTDLFQACALLHATRSASCAAHADALMRTLGEALGQTPVMHAPGTQILSFDEKWLMALATAVTAEDEASVAFLLNRRILPQNRRLIRFLVGRVSDCFGKV